MSEGNSSSEMDSSPRMNKRKASPDKMTIRKRIRVADNEHPSTSEDEVKVRRPKRKVKEDGEGPLKKRDKRRRLDVLRYDLEVPSSSTDTGSESCNTSVEDVRKRRCKREAAADGEGLTKKKRPDPEMIKEGAKDEAQDKAKDEAEEETEEDLSVDAQIAKFKAKYVQQDQLGEGGCGSVFAGYRKADNLPVAIKHIEKDKVYCKHVDKNGKEVSVEVAVMLKLAAGNNGSVGTSAPVSLLDWYDLDQELILVLERPVPAVDLYKYTEINGGSLPEEEAKIILQQLVDAALDLQYQNIFHRDIKVENILIETGSNVPRVRIIDFGLSCFFKQKSFYRVFYGTTAHSPPEWYSRSTYRPGPTTVWQMGVVLYETLHSDAIFQTTAFLRNKLSISNELSKDCQDFLRTCLTKDPQQRVTLEQLRRHPWLR